MGFVMNDTLKEPLRVCYFGTYRANYNRNQIMIAGLRRVGVEVIECHEPLWRGMEDRSQVAVGGWLKPVFWVRAIRVYTRLLFRYRKIGDYDVLVVGYPGILDVFLARVLTRLRGKPLVWDVLLSVYEAACERGWQQSHRSSVRFLHWLEAAALRLPDLGLLDTPQYTDWFRQEYSRIQTPLDYVLIGADDRYFSTQEEETGEADSGKHKQNTSGLSKDCRVLYYGTYLPNHGIGTILEAARLLANELRITIEMVGQGIEQGRARALALEYKLTNILFIDWLDKQELANRIVQADILLGAFGNTLHSLATIHNKTYEGLAMGKVVLTGDAPVMRQFFQHGKDVYLCPQADPQALAQSIRSLCADPGLRQQIGMNGQRLWREHYTLEHTGRTFAKILARQVDIHGKEAA